MKRFIVYLALVATGVCQAEVPRLFTEKNFTSITLAEAANHYIALGKEASLKELTDLSKQEDSTAGTFLGNGISVSERIGWVCRIVFVADGSKSLRPPEYGDLDLPEKFKSPSDWPLYPLAQSGSTFVVLAQNYTARSTPETAAHYIKYCASHGLFRSAPVPVPTREQALSDTLALRQSDRWEKMIWEDKSGVSFPMGEQFTYAFYFNQARMIPEASTDTMLAKDKTKPSPLLAETPATPAPVVVKTEPLHPELAKTAMPETNAVSTGPAKSAPVVEASVLSFH